MRRSLPFALLALLALTTRLVWAEEAPAAASAGVEDETDEYADVSRAHLIVRKYVKDEYVVQGRNVTVYIDIYNGGSSTGYKVSLKDTLPSQAQIVEGSLEASWPYLSVGSHAYHQYTISFTQGNLAEDLPQAVVQYGADSETDVQYGTSSVQTIYVYTPVQQIQRYALQVGAYASLGFAREPSDWRNLAIIVGAISVILGGNWAYKSIGAANKSRKHKAALASLEKNE